LTDRDATRTGQVRGAEPRMTRPHREGEDRAAGRVEPVDLPRTASGLRTDPGGDPARPESGRTAEESDASASPPAADSSGRVSERLGACRPERAAAALRIQVRTGNRDMGGPAVMMTRLGRMSAHHEGVSPPPICQLARRQIPLN
jgi:hypothetical protein